MRCLNRNQFDEASTICVQYNLSSDPISKRQWAQVDGITVEAIDTYLCAVDGDLFWKLEQCRLQCGDDANSQRHLLQVAISLTDHASRE